MRPDHFNTLLDGLLDEVGKPQVLLQLLVLAAVVLLAWLIGRWIRGRVRASGAQLGEARALTDLLFPALIWLGVLIVRSIGLRLHQPVSMLHIALVLAGSFVLVRLVIHALRRVFSPSGPLIAFERSIAVLVWSGVALHVLGWLPEVLQAADVVVLPLGKVQLSMLQLAQGALTVGVTVIVALWAGAALEARLLGVQTMDASLRVVLSRTGNALLIIVAILVSLSLVGIDLTILSVFGGALGVGLGLGFQRIASSYVSGFIILLDRSLRIGDLITVDKYHGTVAQIRTRYTVLRALDGTDAIIPNDLLVSQAVLNHSFADRRLRVGMKLQIDLNADVDRALELMAAAAADEPRVLAEPAPAAYLSGLTSGGLELELGFWIEDPERGSLRVKSAILRRIWASFREHGIHLPPDPAKPPVNPAANPAVNPPNVVPSPGPLAGDPVQPAQPASPP